MVLTIAVGACAAARPPRAWTTLPAPPPLPPAIDVGRAELNGIAMYYAIYGAGEPVVLLHGGLADSDCWGNQVPALAARHRVIVADSRGHGRSTRASAPLGYHLMASDVLALMDHLGIRRASIVGWSDGAIIGLDLAIHHPERVRRLFAFAANYTTAGLRPDVGDNATFKAYIAEARRRYEQISPTPHDWPAFEAAVTTMWSTEPAYTRDQLAGIRVPTVIADGDHDEAILRSHTEEMARLIPGAKLVILRDASHFAMLQQPAAFNRAVLEFLTSP